MNIEGLIIATSVIGLTGLAIGLLLGIAGVKFKVDVDEKEEMIRTLLPGNNCGGCGLAGCDALAKAIVAGTAPVNGCPVASVAISSEIASVMGVNEQEKVKQVAYVKCSGTCDKTELKYNYFGLTDCKKLALIPGKGDKKCSYGCMGYGSCVKVCQFDAIHIVNGIAKVDKEKCVACNMCVGECPKRLIEMVPYEAIYRVACNSYDKGKEVKEACKAGCIGCGICAKVCEYDAVSVQDNLAYIDQSKCVACGKCAQKCPVHVIG